MLGTFRVRHTRPWQLHTELTIHFLSSVPIRSCHNVSTDYHYWSNLGSLRSFRSVSHWPQNPKPQEHSHLAIGGPSKGQEFHDEPRLGASAVTLSARWPASPVTTTINQQLAVNQPPSQPWIHHYQWCLWDTLCQLVAFGLIIMIMVVGSSLWTPWWVAPEHQSDG